MPSTLQDQSREKERTGATSLWYFPEFLSLQLLVSFREFFVTHPIQERKRRKEEAKTGSCARGEVVRLESDSLCGEAVEVLRFGDQV